MIYLRRECTPVRNGVNIFREFDRSIGFILRIGKFGWYVRWSRKWHRLFHEISLNMFPLKPGQKVPNQWHEVDCYIRYEDMSTRARIDGKLCQVEIQRVQNMLLAKEIPSIK